MQIWPQNGQWCRCAKPIALAFFLFGGGALLPLTAGSPEPTDDMTDGQLFAQLLELFRAANATKWPKGSPVSVDENDFMELQKIDAGEVAKMSVHETHELRTAHVSLCEWITWHQPKHAHLRDQLLQRAVNKFGLWPSKWQWSEAYHPGLAAAPWHSEGAIRNRWPALADALAILQAAIVPIFVKEHSLALNAAAKNLTKGPQEHPEGLHVFGLWTVWYIYRDKTCKSKHFRQSCAVLAGFDEALRSSGLGRIKDGRFATLHPGTKIATMHTSTNNQRLKVHCGIENPDAVQIRIANLSFAWEPGKCYLIDDSFEHEIESTPEQRARTILEMKITHPDLLASGYFVHGETGRHFPLETNQEL